METWLWSVLLLLVGLLIVGIELFVPSGGILGVLATLAIGGAITLAFMSSVKTGLVMLIVVAAVVPALIFVMLQWWPHTPFGKKILVSPPESEEELLPDAHLRRELKSLIGQHGVAKTMMMPSGIVQVDGRSFDAVGEGAGIEVGQSIRVVGVEMNRLIVRIADTPTTPLRPPQTDNILEQPLESLDIESLDNPLV